MGVHYTPLCWIDEADARRSEKRREYEREYERSEKRREYKRSESEKRREYMRKYNRSEKRREYKRSEKWRGIQHEFRRKHALASVPEPLRDLRGELFDITSEVRAMQRGRKKKAA